MTDDSHIIDVNPPPITLHYKSHSINGVKLHHHRTGDLPVGWECGLRRLLQSGSSTAVYGKVTEVVLEWSGRETQKINLTARWSWRPSLKICEVI